MAVHRVAFWLLFDILRGAIQHSPVDGSFISERLKSLVLSKFATLSRSYSKHLFHVPRYLCRLPINVITVAVGRTITDRPTVTVILRSAVKSRSRKLRQPLKLTTTKPRSTCRPFPAVTLASNFSREGLALNL
jgi:hypothetical protein